jgi:uncharacterized protein
MKQKPPFFRIRNSRIHGKGAFATRRIRKGTRICEYFGDRLSHAAADQRHEHKPDDDNHTFLFIVDRHLVIDGGVKENLSRFINHGCDPNCESVIEGRRVYIEALRTIQPGEELKYDYSIGRADDDPPNIDEVYACRCGADGCRGTMLWPAKRPKKRARRRPAADRKPLRRTEAPRRGAKRQRA